MPGLMVLPRANKLAASIYESFGTAEVVLTVRLICSSAQHYEYCHTAQPKRRRSAHRTIASVP
eukprot:scaffold137449_cov32-Prasinocladus_malaysianus.AAC.1